MTAPSTDDCHIKPFSWVNEFTNAMRAMLNAERNMNTDDFFAVLRNFERTCECTVESGCYKAQAEAVVRLFRPKCVEAPLYYEVHVTLDPVFDEDRKKVEQIANRYSFRLAKLIMRKREGDAETPHEDDTFMTLRSKDYWFVEENTKQVVIAMQRAGFVVRRYKIEDTILDSNHGDRFKLLSTEETPS